jgi:hypothetical protein
MVRCRTCGASRKAGCTGPGGCPSIALLAIGLAGIAAWQAAERGGERGTVWALVLPVPAFLLTALVVVLVLGHGIRLVDFLLSRGAKCQACGSRRWSYPYADEKGGRSPDST